MQRTKGQSNNQVSNGPKDHQPGEHPSEDIGFETWRGGNVNQQHHSSYPIGGNDHYTPTYYGTSFPYQAFGAAGDGTWSNGSDPVTFLPGYGGGQMNHDAYGMEGVFSNTGGSFGNFGQPNYGNYFHGNGDFSAWGSSRKNRYEDYYPPRSAEGYGIGDSKSIEQGVQGLSIGSKMQSRQDQQLQVQSIPVKKIEPEKRKITWASVASQPAKPVVPVSSSQGTKKKSGIAPPPIVPGKHNMDIGTWGDGAKSTSSIPPPKVPPPASPPHPGIPGGSVPPQQPLPTVQQHQQQQQRQDQRGSTMQSVWNRQPQSPPSPSAQIQAMHHQQYQQQQQQHAQSNQHHFPNKSQGPSQHHHYHHQQQQQHPQQPQPSSGVAAANNPVLDELKDKNNYNPLELEQCSPSARFFVIKSYSEDDIHRSIKYEIWCSTEHGNKRLDQAYREASRDSAPLYLFFSVNGSGHFCGMAQMVSSVDYKSNSSVWSQDKWKGQFRVRWIYVKDVPNVQLRHIKLENNENKPVTNSRDAQEVPHAKGIQVLRILHSYRHSTSIFDDFGHYEKRQAEEDQRKVVPGGPTTNHPHHHHHSQVNHRGADEAVPRGGRNEGPGRGAPNHHPNDLRESAHHGPPHHQRRDRGDNRGRGRGGLRQ